MLVRDRLIDKLQRALARYKEGIFSSVAELEVSYVETEAHLRRPPESNTPAASGMKWGSVWANAWFRSQYEVPESLNGKRLYLAAETGGAESLVFLDGEPLGALDSHSNALEATNANDDGPIGYAVVKGHATRLLCRSAKAGAVLDIAVESYAGHPNPGCHPHARTYEESSAPENFEHRFQSLFIVIENDAFKGLVFDLLPLLQLATMLPEDSLRRAEIYKGLANVYEVLPQLPGEVSEGEALSAIAKARSIMKPLLEAKNGTTAPRLGLIGHSHMDTAWLWPVKETIRKCARTFAGALEMSDSYEEFLWLQTCPVHSEFMRDHYPGLFERIQSAVARGAWEINGGTYVEPDCNIPCGEALLRNFLVGDQMNRALFDKRSNCFWQPDVFGYSAALPQIMKGVGIDYFLTTKLSWNDSNRFPYDTFRWRGLDGTEVVSHFNVTHTRPDPLSLDKHWKTLKHKDIQDRRLVAYGLGDGGSGVQFQMLETARRVGDLEGCPRTENTKLGDFMEKLDEDLSEGLPTWNGELYLELHRGVLTSQPDLKKGNRRSELLVRQAEWTQAVEGVANGGAYPAEDFKRIWKKLLLNQFHDILPGTSIAPVHIEAKEDFDTICRESLELSGRGEGLVDLSGSDEISILNTRSWERNEFVLENFPKGYALDAEGVSTQAYTSIGGTECLKVSGTPIAPMAARRFTLSPAQRSGESSFEWSDPLLKTPLAEIRFGENGEIVSYLDRESGKEWLPAEADVWNRFASCVDVPRLWDNWDLDAEDAQQFAPVGKLVSRKVLEDGPLLFRLEQVIELSAESRIRQICSISATGCILNFETELNWQETHRFLKVSFDAPVRAAAAKHEIQYGFVERPTHQSSEYDRARFEHSQHRWSDLSDAHSGISVFNDSKYGVSTTESSIALSLMKSGTHPDHRGSKGTHFFNYAVKPHQAAFSAKEVVQPAHDYNDLDFWSSSARAWPETSFLALDSDHVSIDWLKGSEDGSGVIARLYELEGAAGVTQLSLPAGDWAVSETNMLEEVSGELEVVDGTVSFSMRGFEIKTLLLQKR